MPERRTPHSRQADDTATSGMGSAVRVALGIGLPLAALVALSWAARKTLHAAETALETGGAGATAKPVRV